MTDVSSRSPSPAKLQHQIEEKEVVRVPFFRSVQFAVLIAGLVTFTAPGMYDAIGNLGAGGAAEPWAVSAANAIVYGLMTLFCLLSGGLINTIGVKWALVLGTIGYPLYGAGLYTNSYTTNTWFLIFGSVFIGISAGFFWTAEASIYIGYPEPGQKGRYLAQWSFWKNIAPAVGGAVSLGVNSKTETGGAISAATYIVFIVIMCLGLPISMFLPSPAKVLRSDGSSVPNRVGKGALKEVLEVFKLYKDKRVLLLLPSFICSYFYLSWQSIYLSTYFNVRTRSLSSLVSPFAGIISSYAMGFYLDQRHITVRTRATVTLAILFFAEMGLWIWATVIEKEFAVSQPIIDWTSPEFGKAWVLVFFWTFVGQAIQNYFYWVISHFAKDIHVISRYAGLFRSMEALGQTIAWAVASKSYISSWALIGMNFGGLFVALILAYPVVRNLTEIDAAVVGEDGSLALGHEKEVPTSGSATPEDRELRV